MPEGWRIIPVPEAIELRSIGIKVLCRWVDCLDDLQYALDNRTFWPIDECDTVKGLDIKGSNPVTIVKVE